MSNEAVREGVTRRELLATLALPMAAEDADPAIPPDLVERHDGAVERQLARQITDPAHRYRGGVPDESGLYGAGAPAGLLQNGAAAFTCQNSHFYQSNELAARMRLAAKCLAAMQNEHGNIDLPVTNFNSPPDTGFVTHSAACAALLFKRAGASELYTALMPFLTRAGGALAVGGVHTPNHRWVICQALAQIHELSPDARYLRRIDQWLAEGIDIDADGQYTERSTAIYNAVCNHALATLALKLRRPELLAPVRRNLDAILYLLHADGEVETGISRRQDRYTAGSPARHWFALRLLAILDGDGRFAALTRKLEREAASLPLLLEFEELRRPLPADAPLPEDYVRFGKSMQCQRIRRGATSITVYGDRNSRFLTLRHGRCVVEAVRCAAAFFGQGQFRAERFEIDSVGAVVCSQQLEGRYFQPFTPSRRVSCDDYDATRAQRSRSEVMRLDARLRLVEAPGRLSAEFSYEGTCDVPYAVEIALRAPDKLEGCVSHAGVQLLRDGDYAIYRVGDHAIRFGPGASAHTYTQVRGAEERIAATSVYLCGFTPDRRALHFEFL